MKKAELQLQLVADIGEQLLKNGAEIFRVNESIERMIQIYKIEKSHVYVIANGIFISAKDENGHSISEVRQVPLGATHLERVASLNQLVRDICNCSCTFDEALERLEQIKELPDNSFKAQLCYCILGIGAFSYLFGGGVLEVLIAIIIGSAEQLFLYVTRKGKLAKLVRIVLASFFVALLAYATTYLNVAISQDIIIIGAIMPLLPGVAFTTSVRELYNGDYVSGMIHLLDTLIITLCIAVGIYLPIAIMQQLGGVI